MNKLIVFIVIFCVSCNGSYMSMRKKDDPKRPYKCGAVYTSKKKVIRDISRFVNFFQLKKGDIIADIGASSGSWEGLFSVVCDSMVFYLEDIDTSCMNKTELDKVIRHYSKVKGSPITNEFNIVLGTEKSTNLPNEYFDKIIMNLTYHEFSSPNEMIADIYTKLKPNGKLFISDNFSPKDTVIIHLGCGIKLPKVDDVRKIVEGQGFEFIRSYYKAENAFQNMLEFKKIN